MHVGVANQAATADHASLSDGDALHGDDTASGQAAALADGEFRVRGDEKVGGSRDDVCVRPRYGVDHHIIPDDQASTLANFDVREAVAADVSAEFRAPKSQVGAGDTPVKAEDGLFHDGALLEVRI